MSKEKKNKKFRMALSTKISIGLLSLGLIGAVSATVVGNHVYKKYQIEEAVQKGYDINIQDADFKQHYKTQVLDASGNVLQEFSRGDFEYISYKDMPKYLPDALVSIEDSRFKEHKGVDIQGFPAIIQSKLTGGEVRGASTLTQQLVKNVYLTNEQTITRKVTEMVLAQKIEDKYSKNDILEFYLNNVYFGHGAYGINTASLTYFGHSIKEATLYEVATLVGITNNPTLFDPVNQPENSLKRTKIILSEMVKQGYISEKDKEDALAHPSQAQLNLNQGNQITDYAVKFAIDNTVENLMKADGFVFQYSFSSEDEEKEYKKKYAESYDEYYQKVINGGFVINTSINQEIQKQVQQIVTDTTAGKGVQATATVIDNQTNTVVAIVGGIEGQGEFNRASQSFKQPGSAIKPYISYTPALERGYTPNTPISDAKGNSSYPDNWYSDSIYQRNDLTLTKALEISANRPAYRLASEMPDPIDPLAKMNFRGLSYLDHNPITSIGGFTHGVRNVDMAAAVNTLVSGGAYHSPTNVTKITQRSSDSVVYDRSEEASPQVYTPQASYQMLGMMKSVVFGSEATGKYGDFGYPFLAAKTGTTDYYIDLWYTGATPYYSVAIWTGGDENISQSSWEQQKLPSYVFKNVMTYLHQGKPQIDFTMKSGSKVNADHSQYRETERENLAAQIATYKTNPLDEGVVDKALYENIMKAIQNLNNQTFTSYDTLNNITSYLTSQKDRLLSDKYKANVESSLQSLIYNKQYQIDVYNANNPSGGPTKAELQQEKNNIENAIKNLQDRIAKLDEQRTSSSSSSTSSNNTSSSSQ